MNEAHFAILTRVSFLFEDKIKETDIGSVDKLMDDMADLQDESLRPGKGNGSVGTYPMDIL